MNPQGEHGIAQQHTGLIESWPSRDFCMERIVVRRNQRISSVCLRDVDWIRSSRNYVELHHGDEVLKSRCTLTTVAELAPARQFLRISRTTIVNLEAVDLARTSLHGTIRIQIRHGSELAVSRRYTRMVRDALEGLAEPQ